MSLLTISSISTFEDNSDFAKDEFIEEEEAEEEEEAVEVEADKRNAEAEVTQILFDALLAVAASKFKFPCSNRYKLLFKNRNYYGGFLLNNQPHGDGEMTWNNGDYYKGTFLNGKIHGEGNIKYANGVVYNGEFRYNKWHGQGILTTPSWEYKGEFQNGYMHGKGSLIMNKNFTGIGQNVLNAFDGEFCKNTMAWGYRTYENGVFHGNFTDFGYRNEGRFLFDNNDLYDGSWFSDQICDFGTYKWSRNVEQKCKGIYLKRPELYSGYWVDGKRHGIGRTEFMERIICCEWTDGKRNGAGLIIAANGTLFVETNMYYHDNYSDCTPIVRSNRSKSLINEIISLTNNKVIKGCKSRSELFRLHIASLEQLVLWDRKVGKIYPVFLTNYLTSWHGLPILPQIMKQFSYVIKPKIFKIEMASINRVIKESFGTLMNIYKTYTTFQLHCNRTDLLLTRLGLWKFYEDVFQHIPSVNKADLIEQVEDEFDIWVENPNSPWEKVYFWEFICHIAGIVTKLNENVFILYAAFKDRISFLGVFSQMFLVFLREFSYLQRLRPSFLMQTMARGPMIIKKFFEKIYLEPKLTIRSAFRYFQLNKSNFKNLNYIDFTNLCVQLYPHIKDKKTEIFTSTTDSITPLELFEIAFKVAEENLMKDLMVEHYKEIERLQALAEAEALAERDLLIKAEKEKKKKEKQK